MASSISLYILAVMIFYDFSLHLTALIFGGKKKALRPKFYWPPSRIFKNDNDGFYQTFWTSYWGLAFVLIVIYILTI